MIEGKWPWPTPLLVNNRFGFDYLCAEVGKGKWISPSYFPLKDRVWELHGRLGRKVSLCSDTCRKDIWSILAAVVFNNYLTYTRALFVGTRKPWGGGQEVCIQNYFFCAFHRRICHPSRKPVQPLISIRSWMFGPFSCRAQLLKLI